jgi:hypothetical protein
MTDFSDDDDDDDDDDHKRRQRMETVLSFHSDLSPPLCSQQSFDVVRDEDRAILAAGNDGTCSAAAAAALLGPSAGVFLSFPFLPPVCRTLSVFVSLLFPCERDHHPDDFW